VTEQEIQAYVASLRGRYSRQQKCDLETALGRAVLAVVDREFPGPGGNGTCRFRRVFDDWASFDDQFVNPSACVLPETELLYEPAKNVRVIEGTWEREGEMGLGLYKLGEATREFEIAIRAETAALRNALKAGLEQVFIEERVTLAPINGSRSYLVSEMPDYWGLECAFTLLGSRKLDDGETGTRRISEARIRLSGWGTWAKLALVQPFRPRTRVIEDGEAI
jgi:hypothetical protein